MEMENVLVIFYHRMEKDEVRKREVDIIRQYHKRLGKFLKEYERRNKKNGNMTQKN